ncbi:polysaccharide deacetylase family protein [Singulisphaera sp. PoT]|uniref:polysaccharide deacetylase family protein n=1 Tax=Singulisphaera sp. PoT TaxID=3411797 RepID=UPI003BF4A13A
MSLPVSNWCQVPVHEFESQISFITDEYRVLPLNEVMSRIRSGSPLPPNTACITFDDGFRNVMTTAFPILQHHGLPSTIFLVTSLVGTNQPPWPDQLEHAITQSDREEFDWNGLTWPLRSLADCASACREIRKSLKSCGNQQRLEALEELREALGWPRITHNSTLATMGWEEIEELADTGLVDFGAHTHTHPILARCNRRTQTEELRNSRAILMERLGKADLLAYPNGSRSDFNAETKQIAREEGFLGAVTTINGLNSGTTDPFELRRVGVGPRLSRPLFDLRMTGIV